MTQIAFNAFIWACIYGIPVSLTCLLLCIPWATRMDGQSSSMDSDYYGHELPDDSDQTTD